MNRDKGWFILFYSFALVIGLCYEEGLYGLIVFIAVVGFIPAILGIIHVLPIIKKYLKENRGKCFIAIVAILFFTILYLKPH